MWQSRRLNIERHRVYSFSMEQQVWFASDSPESEIWRVGPYDTREEAFTEGKEYYPDAEFIYFGRGDELCPAQFIDAEEIFDRLEDGMENCPAEDSWQCFWGIDSKKLLELTARLQNVFEDWATFHRLPKYYNVSCGYPHDFEPTGLTNEN